MKHAKTGEWPAQARRRIIRLTAPRRKWQNVHDAQESCTAAREGYGVKQEKQSMKNGETKKIIKSNSSSTAADRGVHAYVREATD